MRLLVPAICRLWLICSWLLFSSPVQSLENAGDYFYSWLSFIRTIRYLQQSQHEQVKEFAIHALTQLADAYVEEAVLARIESTSIAKSDKAKLLRWSRTVDQIADQLVSLTNDIEQGAAVKLLQSQDDAIIIFVDGRSVILEHPRIEQQPAYEQLVLAEFCARNDCECSTAELPEQEPFPVYAARVQPGWSFSSSGQLCSYDGIEVRFASTKNLSLLRSTCEKLMQELNTLAHELIWQHRHGIIVDWSTILISPSPQRPEHLVRLNSAGDTILVSVPLLFGNPGLIEDIKPWLYYKIFGGEPVIVQLDAANYGWL